MLDDIAFGSERKSTPCREEVLNVTNHPSPWWRCLTLTDSSKQPLRGWWNPPFGEVPIGAVAGVFAVGAAALALAVPAASAQAPPQRLTRAAATKLVLDHPRIAAWLDRYQGRKLLTVASYRKQRGVWDVKVFAGVAGEVALGTVDDRSGRVLEAWSGPQVAWPIARGPLGGKQLNRVGVWLAFCAVFLAGLANFRKPLTVRNLDLFVLLSFSASLWYFNHGHVFASASLAYPPLAYLLARCAWTAWRGGSGLARPLWPVWLLVAATCFLVSFRTGLTLHSSSVIDVGYAGVIGADRIEHGRVPYGNFPIEGNLPACGRPDANGRIHERIQPDGRCETANPFGDTYGPVTYEAYLPGLWLFGWTGRWDRLPAVRYTTVAFDLLAVLGLAAVGLRFGGPVLAAMLAFAWAAYPFTQYAANANTNDTLMPALLVWGFFVLTSDLARGALSALAGWAKFAALIVAPLWASYPTLRRPRHALLFAFGFLLATVACGWIVLLDGNPAHALHVFYERTISIQVHRRSPFSIWDWGQYHAAGLPDLHVLQKVLQALLVIGAFAVALFPRQKSPLQLAALTAVLLIGFEIVLTHWSLLYITWFFPFAALALLSGSSLSTKREPGDAPAASAKPLPRDPA